MKSRGFIITKRKTFLDYQILLDSKLRNSANWPAKTKRALQTDRELAAVLAGFPQGTIFLHDTITHWPIYTKN